MTGSEADGLYRLLRGAISHSSMFSAPPHLKDVIMFLHHRCIQATPSGVQGVKPKPSTPVAEGSQIGTRRSPSLAVSQALEAAIPTHMTPLCLNVGGIKRVYKCHVEGSISEGPSTSQAAICPHVCCDHLGVRFVQVPPVTKPFSNWMPCKHHKKLHSSDPQ